MSVDNKAFVRLAQELLKEQGVEMKTTQLYELFSKLIDNSNWNVVKAKGVNFKESVEKEIDPLYKKRQIMEEYFPGEGLLLLDESSKCDEDTFRAVLELGKERENQAAASMRNPKLEAKILATLSDLSKDDVLTLPQISEKIEGTKGSWVQVCVSTLLKRDIIEKIQTGKRNPGYRLKNMPRNSELPKQDKRSNAEAVKLGGWSEVETVPNDHFKVLNEAYGQLKNSLTDEEMRQTLISILVEKYPQRLPYFGLQGSVRKFMNHKANK